MRANDIIGRSGVIALVVLLVCSIGCGPPASQGNGQGDPASSGETPELTDEIIRSRIIGRRVYEIMPESGTGEPIPWSFDEDEPKEITIIDKKVTGDSATVVLDIKTQSNPRARNLRALAGQIRTDWRLETGWVLRRWEVVNTENISMKYRDLPKPSQSPPLLPPGGRLHLHNDRFDRSCKWISIGLFLSSSFMSHSRVDP